MQIFFDYATIKTPGMVLGGIVDGEALAATRIFRILFLNSF
jgi:hypothetical protein